MRCRTARAVVATTSLLVVACSSATDPAPPDPVDVAAEAQPVGVAAPPSADETEAGPGARDDAPASGSRAAVPSDADSQEKSEGFELRRSFIDDFDRWVDRETEAAEGEETPFETEDNPAWIDRMRTSVDEAADDTVRWVDTLFGDQRVEGEAADSRIRANLGLELGAEGIDLDPKIKVRLAMPQTEGRLGLILATGSDSDLDSGLSDDDDLPEPQEDDETNFAAGLRFAALLEEDYSLTFDAGINFRWPPDPFVRGRFRHNWDLGWDVDLSFQETAYWRSQKGFGQITRFDFDRPLTFNSFVRSTSRAEISEVSDGLEWNQALYYNYVFPSRDDFFDSAAIQLSVGVFGATQPAAIIRSWTARVRWRQRFLRDWLWYGLEPEVSWPIRRNRKATPAITLRLGILFD